MNFQTVREAEGQMDGQYQMKVSMFGIPQEVGEVTFTPKGKKIQQVMILDDKGEIQKVKIFGGKMTSHCVGEGLSFQIAPYTSDQNHQTYYSGFWNDRAGASQAPQGQQQAPSQPAQRPNVPKSAPSNKDRLIVAQVVYKTMVSAWQGSLAEFDIWLMGNLKIYNRHIDTIMHAGAGTLVAPTVERTEPPAPELEDDIPF